MILDIVEDMKVLCPDAWLVNFTNPSGMVTEAVLKYGNFEKVVGLCNVPIVHTMKEAELINKNPDDLFFHYAGLNHHHWHKVYDKYGNEITLEIMDKLFSQKENTVENITNIPFAEEQIRDLGMLPCAYHRYYYLTDDMLQKELEEYSKNETRAEQVKKTEAELFELYKDPNLKEKPKQLEKRGGKHYSDAACELISSIYNDKKTNMTVSTRNNGAISDLPYDCASEITSIITASGPKPINFGSFKPAERGLLQVMKAMEEVTIEAAVTGNYGTALQAFTLNPLVPSGNLAKIILNEMLVAHKKHLPQFADTIAKIESGKLK